MTTRPLTRLKTRPRTASRQRQRGATAIEFAIVFPLFFLVFYAIVTYSLIFAAQQMLTLAAEEGARAALRYQPNAQTVDAALALRANAACKAATGVFTLLGASTPCVATPALCSYDNTMRCIQVTLTYDYARAPLVPSLPLLRLALPDQLAARATVQLNPENVL